VIKTNLCRCNKGCPNHAKDMARSEYGSAPLKWVRDFNPILETETKILSEMDYSVKGSVVRLHVQTEDLISEHTKEQLIWERNDQCGNSV
jgi:hypothetical protein